MAEPNVQSKAAKTTSYPQTQKPKWGKRILENLKLAGAATFLAGALALSSAGCGNAQIRPVVPAYAYPGAGQAAPSNENIPEQRLRVRAYFLPNPILDPKLGTFYHRPDGMDAILAKPEIHGYPELLPAFPILALAIFEK